MIKYVSFVKYITPTVSTYFKAGKNICTQDSTYFKMGKDHYRFRIIQNGHDRQQKVWDTAYTLKQSTALRQQNMFNFITVQGPKDLVHKVTCQLFVTTALISVTGIYINKIQREATVCRCLFTAKLLYSGFYPTHHQEYIKL